MRPPGSTSFEHTLMIAAAPMRVMAAFFDPAALAVWWQTTHSVATPRVMGIYAVEWAPTPDEDDVLGRLGGVFYGSVIEYKAGRELFVGDAWWLPPDGEPLGPMALEVHCAMDGPACRLRVVQGGLDQGPRWDRYYEVVASGWRASLAALKELVESA